MNTFLLILLVFFAVATGIGLGVIFTEHKQKDRFSKYEKSMADYEKKQAVLAEKIKDELSSVRNGLQKTALAYENVVKLVENEFGIKDDLHIVPILPGGIINYDKINLTPCILPIYSDQNQKKDHSLESASISSSENVSGSQSDKENTSGK